MNTLFLLLDGAAAAPKQGGATMWIMLILLFAVFYIFMILPQNKKQKQLKAFRESLKEGDKVVTIGGIYGKVAQIKEDGTVLLEVDNNVRIKLDKNSIVQDSAAANEAQAQKK
jgi:preprotein translocase subunit YajC